MKLSNMLPFERESAFEEHDEIVKNENEMPEKIMYMPTLPSSFKSLVGKNVRIEREEPQYVIELLGDLLGITDYATNKSAFWFLDTVALQVLRYKDKLDDYNRGILISWLAGEIKLIRDNKLLRDDFFKQMSILFLRVAEKTSASEQLLHWELLVNEIPEKSPTNSKVSPTAENSDTFIDSSAIVQSINAVNSNAVLHIIIDATYSMYANELRYALVYAVFVRQVQIHTFHMPHTLRTPREVKLTLPGVKSFDVQLQEQLKKSAAELTSGSRNGKKQKKKGKMKKDQVINDLNAIVLPPTPSISLTEEEILINSRRFILPLAEAKEAAQILGME